MSETTNEPRRYRSLFWPVILISAGVILLLGNAGIITWANVVSVLRLWPLLLILIGIDLLFGRSSPMVGALIGIGAVVLIVIIMLAGPALGLAGDTEVKTFTGSVPLEDAEAAEVSLSLSVGDVTIRSLSDSSNVLEADLSYVGNDAVLESSGERTKVVSLHQEAGSFTFYGPLDFLQGFFDQPQLRWNIGLSDRVPLELQINASLGTGDFDLRDLNLTNLRVNAGAGDVTLTLPATDARYEVVVNGGVGNYTLVIPEPADIDMRLNGGAGNFIVETPAGAGVRLHAETGVGNIEVESARLERVGGDDDRFVGDSGEWETDNYDEAERRIDIDFRGGVGNLTVR
ncbi:MAG: hypothetical protein Kow00120_23960 [Anaerolineae bacterium]